MQVAKSPSPISLLLVLLLGTVLKDLLRGLEAPEIQLKCSLSSPSF